MASPSHGEQCDPRRPSDNPLPQKRVRRYPRRYNDFIPTSFMPLDHTPVYKTKRQRLAEQAHTRRTPPPKPEQVASPLIEPVITEPNGHGLFRIYSVSPARDPKVTLSRLTDHNAGFTGDSVPAGPIAGEQLVSGVPDLSYGPLSNSTELDFMERVNSIPSELSREKAQAIVDIIRAEPFSLDDMKKINVDKLNKQLDAYSLENHLAGADRISGSVKLRLPCKGVKCPESKPPEFEVKGVHYRRLVDVIKGVHSRRSVYS